MLEVHGQQVARKLCRLPHNEAAGRRRGEGGRRCASEVSASRRRRRLSGAALRARACACQRQLACPSHLWPSAPQAMVWSVEGSSTRSYLQRADSGGGRRRQRRGAAARLQGPHNSPWRPPRMLTSLLGRAAARCGSPWPPRPPRRRRRSPRASYSCYREHAGSLRAVLAALPRSAEGVSREAAGGGRGVLARLEQVHGAAGSRELRVVASESEHIVTQLATRQ